MNKQIYEEAAEWLVEIRVGNIDGTARARLDNWFRVSPQHIRAFLELSNIWEEGADRDISSAFSTAELIARARAAGTNVIVLGAVPSEGRTLSISDATAIQPLEVDSRGERIPALSRRAAQIRPGISRLAASIAFLAITVGAFTFYRSSISTYTTGIGEQRTVTLQDGSRIELNARSTIHVRFSKQERDIELLAGQALFKVAKDPSRPFVVTSDEARVRAVGTQFDIYQKPSGTTVTVLEGRVAVLTTPPGSGNGTLPQRVGAPGPGRGNTDRGTSVAAPAGLVFPGASPGVLVSAGEQVIVTAQLISEPKRTNTAVATAWTQRELVFDETSLTDVAAEFNLYNEKPLIVSDTSLRDFHVTGVFSSTDPTSLLKFLRAQEGIRVQETDKGILIARQ